MIPLQQLDPKRFETPEILKLVARASRALGELKGAMESIPRQDVLLNTLGLQEAKESSEIENIVTTHDEIYREESRSSAEMEVRHYVQALRTGYERVIQTDLITINHLCEIQSEIIKSRAGVRTLPGTHLRNSEGDIVYSPPQEGDLILGYLRDLERFINEDDFDADPLVKMALIHHQFESIHPFYDGNGRTGRILNILYLVKEKLLGMPVLYLSRPLMKTKAKYYSLLQAVRDEDRWEDWVAYMLLAIEECSNETNQTVKEIGKVMRETKHQLRNNHKFYSQDLINTLFSHPYTKIKHIMASEQVSRPTATKYLEAMTASGLLNKIKVGRTNYYINTRFWQILTADRMK